MRTIEVKATYAADADEMFADAMSFAELRDAMSGLATYEGLPADGLAEQGARHVVDVTMWGWLKTRGHVMEIETVDYESRIAQSREHNPAIKRWDHTISIQPENGKTVWTDTVVLDAGWRTVFVSRFVVYVYTYRHRARKALRITHTIH